jgi:hypothetical protein
MSAISRDNGLVKASIYLTFERIHRPGLVAYKATALGGSAGDKMSGMIAGDLLPLAAAGDQYDGCNQ